MDDRWFRLGDHGRYHAQRRVGHRYFLDKHLSEHTADIPICIKTYLRKAVNLFALTLLTIFAYFITQHSTLIQILSVFLGLLCLPGLATATAMLLWRNKFALKIDGRGIHETLISGSRFFAWDDVKTIGIDKTPVGRVIALECDSERRGAWIVSGQYNAHLWHTYSVGNDDLLERLNAIRLKSESYA